MLLDQFFVVSRVMKGIGGWESFAAMPDDVRNGMFERCGEFLRQQDEANKAASRKR